MGYDPAKDDILAYRIIENGEQTGGYEVKLLRYKKGSIKVQIDSFFYGSLPGQKKYNTGKRFQLSYAPTIFAAIKDMEDNLDKSRL